MGQPSPHRAPPPSDQSDEVGTGAGGRHGAPRAASERGYTASRLEGAGGEHPQRCLEPSASWPWRGSFQNEACGDVFVTPAPARDPRGPCSWYLECPSWHPGLLHKGPDWHSAREREGGRRQAAGAGSPARDLEAGVGVSDHRASRRWLWKGCAPRLPGLR